MVAILLGGVLGAMRAEVSQANAALFLVLVVIAAAFIGGRWAGGATALASALSFDFFLTQPYGSLAIKSFDDVVTTGLLFVVGIAVGQVAASRREARAASDAGTNEIAGLYRIGQLTSDGVEAEDLIEAVAAEVRSVLKLADCHFRALPEGPSLPELEPSGRVKAPYVHLDDGFAFPPEGVAIAVRSRGRVRGWLVCTPLPGLVGVSRDRRRTALVLADHLGLALAEADAA